MTRIKIKKPGRASEPKPPITDADIRRIRFPRLTKIGKVIYFYARQTLKALLVLLAGWIPIDITHNYVYGITMSTKKVTAAQSLSFNTNLQILILISGILFSAAILFVLFKINWRWSKADVNDTRSKSKGSQS